MALIGILSMLTIFLFILAWVVLLLQPRIAVSERVSAMQRVTPVSQEVGEKQKRRTKIHIGRPSSLQKLEHVLKAAEIDLTVREFLLRFVLIVACVGMIGLMAIGILGPILAVAVSAIVTPLYLRARGERRRRRFNEGLYDMLTIVINSLRAGYSFVQAMHVVNQDLQGPIQEEFTRIEAEMQLGVGMDEALARAGERIGSDDFDLIVTAISIQRQIGGNLAEVLDKISATIRDRVRLKREVKALTSQGRLSASIFMLLPVGVGGLLFTINPSYISVLFTSPMGLGLLIVAAVGQGIGYLLIRRIIKVEL